MSGLRELENAAQDLSHKGVLLRGLLGDDNKNFHPLNDDGTERPEWYVRVAKAGGYELGVFPGRIRPMWNLPVIIQTHPLLGVQYIAETDETGIQIGNSGGNPIVPPTWRVDPHAWTHEFRSGADDVPYFLSFHQIYELRVQPGAAAGHVVVQGGQYYCAGAFHQAYEAVDVDLTTYYHESETRYVLIYFNSTGEVGVYAPGAQTLEALAYPPADVYVTAAVKLQPPADVIDWLNGEIIDLRTISQKTSTETFLGLGDTVDSYTGMARKLVRVNDDANGLVFGANLDDIDNVDAAAPVTGQALVWSGTAWVPDDVEASLTVSDTSSVDLAFDPGTHVLTAAVKLALNSHIYIPEAGGLDVLMEINDLTDVLISSPSSGQTLVYNAAEGAFENRGGSGSGLDADLIDGYHYTQIIDNSWTNVLSHDGPGSGLDADTLDGIHAAGFAVAGHNHQLRSLSDVTWGTPVNGYILGYYDSTNKVEVKAPSGFDIPVMHGVNTWYLTNTFQGGTNLGTESGAAAGSLRASGSVKASYLVAGTATGTDAGSVNASGAVNAGGNVNASGVAAGSVGTAPTAGQIFAAGKIATSGGLSVGSLTAAPSAGQILASGKIGTSGGMAVGTTGDAPAAGEIYMDGDLRNAKGAFFGNKTTDPGDGNVEFTGVLRAYRDGALRTGYLTVPLTSPLTSSDWNGNTKTAASYTIDTSVTFSAPAGIKMALVRLACNWSAASTSYYATVGPAGSTSVAMAVKANLATYNEQTAWVPCDANGDIVITVGGASCLAIVQIWGYVL